ncbi:Uncharacterized protein SCF082_LOCUS18863, partial [Durusdinium trenchii]
RKSAAAKNSLFGKKEVSAQIDTAELGTSTAQVPGPEVELPHLLLVVSDNIFAKRRAVIRRKVDNAEIATKSIEIYNQSVVDTERFQERFATSQPGTGFEQATLYKWFPPEKRFVRAMDFNREWIMARNNEAMYLLKDAGASKIVLDEKLFNSIDDTTRASLNLSVPVATPVGPASGGATAERQAASSSSTGSTVTTTFGEEPEFLPHFNPDRDHWFYEHNEQERGVSLIVQALEKDTTKYPTNTVTIHFSEHRDAAKLQLLNADLMEVVGVGYVRQGNAKAEFKLTVTVHFFSKRDFDEARVYQDQKARANVSTRRSMSMLAGLRVAFHGQRAEYREDVILHTKRGDDVLLGALSSQDLVREEFGDKAGATLNAFASAEGVTGFGGAMASAMESMLALGGFMKRQVVEESGRILTVPFVLYGPKASGKTAALFTFEKAVTGSPQDFINNGKGDWAEMRRAPSDTLSTTFLQNVKFDPDTPRNVRSLRRIDEEIYAGLSTKNVARAVFYDTKPAKDAYTDKDNRSLPFGMRVLVLQLDPILEAHASGAGTQLRVDLEAEIEPFLGERGTSTDLGELSRYPPIATILLTNEDLPRYDDDLPEKIRAGVDWFKESFSLTYVFPMSTFAIPDEELREMYKGDVRVRGTYCSDWRSTAIRAIGVLESIICATAEHELLSVYNLARRAAEAQQQA